MKRISKKGLFPAVLISFLLFSCTTFSPGNRTFSFDKGLSRLTGEIIGSLENRELYRVAVNEFIRIDGERTVLGKALSEELTTGFFNANTSFSLVERSQLEAALSELQLGLSAVFDEKQAAELGRLLGADALVIGSITPFEEYIKINARIFSVEDGRVISAAAVKIETSSEVKDMLNNSLSSISGDVSKTSSPSKKTKNEQTKLVQTIDDFRVELTGLRREGTKLWADFIVTYRGREPEEWIGFHDGRIVDARGLEYDPTSGGTLQVSSGWGGLDCVQDVPMVGKVPFNVGTEELKEIPLLEISFRDRGKLYFKNLTVE